jgi:hypothetical protein
MVQGGGVIEKASPIGDRVVCTCAGQRPEPWRFLGQGGGRRQLEEFEMVKIKETRAWQRPRKLGESRGMRLADSPT